VIGGGVFLAFACWALTFGWPVGNFWVKIGLSVIIVSIYSLFWERPRIPLHFYSFLLGLLSAVLLYVLFYLGNRLAPYILPGAHTQVGGIYALGSGTSRVLIFLLLFFITGPGEEIFWRGFLQCHLMERWGNSAGYLATTAIYAGVHVFSWNLMLVAAASVAGAFWGLLYLWKRDLLVQITSHSFWSAVIFGLAPIQ